MRGETPILVLWTVTWRNCTPLDGVHPQSREGQTDSATVQGHLVHPSVWAPGETNKVNDISCRVLMMQYFTIATMAYDRGISGHNQALLSISNPQTSLACPSGDWAGSSQIGAVSIGETLGFTRYLQGPLSYLSTLTEQQWSICLADTATEGYIQAKRRGVEPLSEHQKLEVELT